MGTERDQMEKQQQKEYAATRIPGTTVCLKGSTAQHDTAPQRRARHGTAPHGTARRCAALLSYIYSWADLSWACNVIQHRSTWYVQTCVVVPVRGIELKKKKSGKC